MKTRKGIMGKMQSQRQGRGNNQQKADLVKTCKGAKGKIQSRRNSSTKSNKGVFQDSIKNLQASFSTNFQDSDSNKSRRAKERPTDIIK